MANNNLVLGGDKIIKILRSLGAKEMRAVYNDACRRAANEVLKPEIRNNIPLEGPYEHLHRIRRNIKVKSSRSRNNPGVYMVIDGRDVPVGQGRSRRFWTLRSYSYLIAHGNYKTPDRRTRGKGRRGNVEGIGNFMEDAAISKGRQARQKAIDYIIPAMEKRMKRYGAK